MKDTTSHPDLASARQRIVHGVPLYMAAAMLEILDGKLRPAGRIVPLWINGERCEYVDAVIANSIEQVTACDDCGARALTWATFTTCYAVYCPQCWETNPRPCHPECFDDEDV